MALNRSPEGGCRSTAGNTCIRSLATCSSIAPSVRRLFRSNWSPTSKASTAKSISLRPIGISVRVKRFVAREAGLAGLPPKCREVVRLRKVEGLTTREAADRLGVGIDTIERQLAIGHARACRLHARRDGQDRAAKLQRRRKRSSGEVSGARDIEDRAARWLIRREEPKWSSEDQARLDAWLEESMAHKAAYWRLEHGWREADRIGALGSAARAEQDAVAFPICKVVEAHRNCCLASRGGWCRRRRVPGDPFKGRDCDDAVRHTPLVSKRSSPLPTAGSVELNTATVMRVAVTDKSRQVWLDKGEAYFEVAHIASRPFVVHAGNKNVTVLGTKFSVRRDDDKVTVSVVQGRVRVEDAALNQASRSSVITGRRRSNRNRSIDVAGPAVGKAGGKCTRVARRNAELRPSDVGGGCCRIQPVQHQTDCHHRSGSGEYPNWRDVSGLKHRCFCSPPPKCVRPACRQRAKRREDFKLIALRVYVV